jgi:hypothetical protein
MSPCSRKFFPAGIKIPGGVAKLAKMDTRKDRTHETATPALIERACEHKQKKRDVAGFESSPRAAKAPVVWSFWRGMASLEIEGHLVGGPV